MFKSSPVDLTVIMVFHKMFDLVLSSRGYRSVEEIITRWLQYSAKHTCYTGTLQRRSFRCPYTLLQARWARYKPHYTIGHTVHCNTIHV
jgi:hypothetical protein